MFKKAAPQYFKTFALKNLNYSFKFRGRSAKDPRIKHKIVHLRCKNRYQPEHSLVLLIPVGDPLFPFFSCKLMLAQNYLGQKTVVGKEARLVDFGAKVTVFRLYSIRGQQHRGLRRAVNVFCQNRVLHLQVKQTL